MHQVDTWAWKMALKRAGIEDFRSRRNTILVPGGKMGYAMELILTPIIHDLLAKRK